MKAAIVLGTRPEIIKMSPLVRECAKRGAPYYILHTGQHYSHEMDRVFFDDLSLPEANYHLDVGSGTHGAQTAKILAGAEGVLMKDRPDIVLVQGDTNTVMAAALAASKLGIRIGHVEAGLRSHDRTMPEETNRVVADHISDQLYAPTEEARKNLAKEGIERGVYVTGNTIVDAVLENRKLAESRSRALENLGLKPREYVLATAHRQENVDSRERLANIIAALDAVGRETGLSVIFPAHPRTQARLQEFGLRPKVASVVQPFGFLDFLRMEAGARLLLTDSGGVQEEGCVLGVPCVTMRENTERPETVDVGANVLAGTDPERVMVAAWSMLNRRGGWKNPFGDGKAAARILDSAERGEGRFDNK
ncbi:MAG: UDP-N-acetylglucosamine 2-epimerase (non-hydrolyzing) [Methanomassiliicoccus sp.]|nr:UDP-N-acetylglucosamine 2-epimerase (non-hydrolyzing) [Methanomassiliicoccus sp.]